MNVHPLIVFVVLAMNLSAGCRQKSAGALETPPRPITIYTEAELNTLIVPGMSASDVTNKFGLPGSVSEINEHTDLMMYSFPLQPEKETLHLAGFTIYVTNGNVRNWSPMMEESRRGFRPGEPGGTYGDHDFQVFLVTDAQSDVLRAVDSAGSADAGGLKTPPDLVFKAKVFSGKGGKEGADEQTVILGVSEQDAPKLKALSEAAIGKRVLIVCRDRVIAAPTIISGLPSRQLMFTVKTAVVLETLRNQR